VQDYRKLRVWERAHRLTLMVYRETAGFPETERYGVTSQLRRSAASVPANIAEGSGRSTARDFARFLDIAMGSAKEVDYHLLLSRDLGYLTPETHAALERDLHETSRMLTSFTNKVRATS